MTHTDSHEPTTKKDEFSRRTAAAVRRQEKRHTEQREEVRREREERARRELERAREQAAAPESRDRIANAIANVAMEMMQAVAASWRIDATFRVAYESCDYATVTRTDELVRIVLPRATLPGGLEDLDPRAIREVLADIKGYGYHELGHLRMTIPWDVLLRAIESEYGPTAVKQTRMASPEYRRVWEYLEDQRIERAMVADSPAMADYFAALALAHLRSFRNDTRDRRDLWLQVAGRDFVPAEVQDALAARFAEAHGWAALDGARNAIEAYVRAVTPIGLLTAVADLVAILRDAEIEHLSPLPSTHAEDDQEHQTQAAQGADLDRSEIDRRLEDSATGAPESAAPEGARDERGRPGHHRRLPGRQSEQGEEHITPTRGELEALVEKHHVLVAMKRVGDRSLGDPTAEVLDTLESGAHALVPATETQPLTAEWHAVALDTAGRLTTALRLATAEDEPIWQGGQTRGVLDPFRYVTRQRADRAFWRGRTEGGNPGSDIAVSLLLDVSGSMEPDAQALGAAAFAAKTACDSVGIACTVSLFHSRATLLWDRDQQPQAIAPVPSGGTDPTEALEALEPQRHGARRHLVLVMTDGVLAHAFTGFRHHSEPGRWFLALGLGAGGDPRVLANLDVDEAHPIASVLDIPEVLTGFLVRHIC